VALLKRALQNKRPSAFYQVPITTKDGISINNVRILPIREGFGRPSIIGHIVAIEDTTEFANLQKQLNLSERMASVGLLAAGVAHEINNPLEIIYNNLSYIIYNFHNKELTDTIGIVKDELSRIEKITSNLLTSYESNEMGNTEFDINTIIANLIRFVRHQAKKENIIIDFRSYRKPIPLVANQTEIEQVLLNLMKNSFEAMNGGGKISVSTDVIKRQTKQSLLIIFEDTGTGITAGNINNVFLPFYSTKKSERKRNVGLGLSVSYSIIKKYGGSITVENKRKAGCRFRIEVPLRIESR
jgi:signal transduction histidine kinase